MAKGSLKKQAFRNELLAILARIEEKLDTRALDLLLMERMVEATEKMAESFYRVANAQDISQRIEPTSEWNPFKDALWRIGVKPEGN